MKVAIAYCYPLVEIRKYYKMARRFADTWRQFPPGLPCELHVFCNGGTPSEADRSPLINLAHTIHARSNSGWDIGAFQEAAELIPADLLICFGAYVHFHKPGWLEQMVEAYVNQGPNLYGCWGFYLPNWHIRTTVFWLHPELLRTYPSHVGTNRLSRYEFEHGNQSLTRHVLSLGLETIMVTRRGVYPFNQWGDHVPGVEDSLVLDQHIHQ